jgi:hypothetical protein
MVKMESEMSSTLHVRSVVASAFCVLDQYTLERFGWLRSMHGEGACGVSSPLSSPLIYTLYRKSLTIDIAHHCNSHLLPCYLSLHH